MSFLKPRKVDKASIEERAKCAPAAPEDDTVAPLNPGFFALERMRAARVVPQRKKLRG